MVNPKKGSIYLVEVSNVSILDDKSIMVVLFTHISGKF